MQQQTEEKYQLKGRIIEYWNKPFTDLQKRVLYRVDEGYYRPLFYVVGAGLAFGIAFAIILVLAKSR